MGSTLVALRFLWVSFFLRDVSERRYEELRRAVVPVVPARRLLAGNACTVKRRSRDGGCHVTSFSSLAFLCFHPGDCIASQPTRPRVCCALGLGERGIWKGKEEKKRARRDQWHKMRRLLCAVLSLRRVCVYVYVCGRLRAPVAYLGHGAHHHAELVAHGWRKDAAERGTRQTAPPISLLFASGALSSVQSALCCRRSAV